MAFDERVANPATLEYATNRATGLPRLYRCKDEMERLNAARHNKQQTNAQTNQAVYSMI